MQLAICENAETGKTVNWPAAPLVVRGRFAGLPRGRDQPPGRDHGKEEGGMSAKGSFEVKLVPQEDGDFPAGRMLIDKTYQGDLEGSGRGQMISKRTPGGAAVYFAIEEVAGTLLGKSGTFTLLHRGHMSPESQLLEVTILEGSGSGELEGISGSLRILQDETGHRYELDFEL
jgi:hypothetical protein